MRKVLQQTIERRSKQVSRSAVEILKTGSREQAWRCVYIVIIKMVLRISNRNALQVKNATHYGVMVRNNRWRSR